MSVTDKVTVFQYSHEEHYLTAVTSNGRKFLDNYKGLDEISLVVKIRVLLAIGAY